MRDVLTAADLDAILRGGGSAEDKLQRAARLGAERERERWRAATEKGRASFANACGILHDQMVHDAWAALNEAIRDIEAEAAAAIRRGEEE